MSSSMWAVLCIRRSEGSHAKSLYSTWAVQCRLSCASGEVKYLMLNPYTAHEQLNVGCLVHQEKWRISLYSTWAVQCGLSYASGEVKDLMLNPYTELEQFNVGCPVHQEKWRISCYILLQHKSSSMWAVLCIRRSGGSHAKSLYRTWAVQCGQSYASWEVKDLMLNPYTAHEQFNVGCHVHQEKWRISCYILIQHMSSWMWAVLGIRRSEGSHAKSLALELLNVGCAMHQDM